MNFLESPKWDGVGAIFSLIAVLITAALHRFPSSRKTISKEIISDSSILNQPEMLSGKVKIEVMGVPVSSLRSIAIQFKNVGRYPILKTDFEGPIKLTLTEPINLLLASPAGVSPPGLPVEIEVNGNDVSIAPLLLNVGDSFIVQCVLDNQLSEISIQARIAGVNNLVDGQDELNTIGDPSALFTLKKIRTYAIWIVLAVVILNYVNGHIDDFFEGANLILQDLSSIISM